MVRRRLEPSQSVPGIGVCGEMCWVLGSYCKSEVCPSDLYLDITMRVERVSYSDSAMYNVDYLGSIERKLD
jgi:hypothetical protein